MFLHALRQKVKEGENSSVPIDDETNAKRNFLVLLLEKGFLLAALIFVLSFWAIALHHFHTSSVFAFTCDVDPLL